MGFLSKLKKKKLGLKKKVLGKIAGGVDKDKAKAQADAAADAATRAADEGQLKEAEEGYANLPKTMIKDLYDRSVSGGTFGATDAFEQGFRSEARANLRGAAAQAKARIAALRKKLGLADFVEDKPLDIEERDVDFSSGYRPL